MNRNLHYAAILLAIVTLGMVNELALATRSAAGDDDDIRVTALDVDGKFAAGRPVRLFVTRQGKRQLLAQEITDDNGQCTFKSNRADDKYTVVLNYGPRATEMECRIEAGKDAEVNIQEKKR